MTNQIRLQKMFDELNDSVKDNSYKNIMMMQVMSVNQLTGLSKITAMIDNNELRLQEIYDALIKTVGNEFSDLHAHLILHKMRKYLISPIDFNELCGYQPDQTLEKLPKPELTNEKLAEFECEVLKISL